MVQTPHWPWPTNVVPIHFTHASGYGGVYNNNMGLEITLMAHLKSYCMLCIQVLERLESGYRLPPPPGTPRAIYELMMQTW